MRQKKLNNYIKEYQQIKEDYIKRQNEPNLMSFFDRNTYNLKGVFNCCLDRLLTRSKQDKHKRVFLARNVPLSNYWVKQSSPRYVELLTLLVSKTKTAR